MKKILYILLLSPALVFSQTEKANTIIIKNISFEEVANAVLDAGYRFDKKDDKYGTIKTEPLSFDGSWSLYLDIRVKDSICYLTGYGYMIDPGVAAHSSNIFINAWVNPSRIENRGMKKSFDRKGFNKMNEFALSVKKEVAYVKN